MASQSGQGVSNAGLTILVQPAASAAPTLRVPQEQRAHVGQLRRSASQGLPIRSSIAESAVNQVVSHRMAKKRQMRWTDEGLQRVEESLPQGF
jgi:hypothetical protein